MECQNLQLIYETRIPRNILKMYNLKRLNMIIWRLTFKFLYSNPLMFYVKCWLIQIGPRCYKKMYGRKTNNLMSEMKSPINGEFFFWVKWNETTHTMICITILHILSMKFTFHRTMTINCNKMWCDFIIIILLFACYFQKNKFQNLLATPEWFEHSFPKKIV